MSASESKETGATPAYAKGSTPPKFSRVLVIGLFGWIILFGAGAMWVSLWVPDHAELRESPFREWDGVWEGEMEIFDEAGNREAHFQVRREYRHVASDDQFRQEGQFRVTDVATGEVKAEKGLRSADFDLTNLGRKVFRERGSVLEAYAGEKNEAGVIEWRREIPGVKETYREWVGGDSYFVEAEAHYGDPLTTRTMRTRATYRRVN